MMRKPFIAFLMIFLASPFSAIAQDHSSANCTPQVLSRIFKFHPDDIKWTKNIQEACRVTNQGRLPHCGIHSATGVLEAYLKKVQTLKAGEHLSIDYYDAVLFKEQVRKALAKNGKVTASDLTGLGITDEYSDLISKGIVFDHQFELPKIKMKDLEGNIEYVTIRDDQVARDAVLERLSAAKDDPKQLEALMDKYLGETSTVKPLKVGPKTSVAVKPNLYIPSRFASSLPYDSKRVIVHQFDQIEDAVRKSLDADVPVSVSLTDIEAIHDAAESATTYLGHGYQAPTEISRVGHSVRIVGYHLDSKGKIDWFLAQNTWGKEWGAQGTFTMSRQYAKDHGVLFSIYNEEQLSYLIQR